jgi:hypothetical protein
MKKDDLIRTFKNLDKNGDGVLEKNELIEGIFNYLFVFFFVKKNKKGYMQVMENRV